MPGVARSPASRVSDTSRWEGRTFGAIVLAAFLLYGIGSATADQPIGLALVLVNSIAVSLAGLIGFRLVRAADHDVGLGYLVARLLEAVLLAGGILMAEVADVGSADTTGYLLAMIALSVGSVPFFKVLRRIAVDSPADRNVGCLRLRSTGNWGTTRAGHWAIVGRHLRRARRPLRSRPRPLPRPLRILRATTGN